MLSHRNFDGSCRARSISRCSLAAFARATTARRVYFWRNVKWDKKSIQEYFAKRLRFSPHGKGPRRITDRVARRYSIVRSPSRQVMSVSLQQQTVSRRRQVGLGRTRPAKETNPICGDKTVGERKLRRKEEAWSTGGETTAMALHTTQQGRINEFSVEVARPTSFRCRRIALAGNAFATLEPAHGCRPCYGVRSARVPSRQTRDRASTSTPSFLSKPVALSLRGTTVVRQHAAPVGSLCVTVAVAPSVRRYERVILCLFAPGRVETGAPFLCVCTFVPALTYRDLELVCLCLCLYLPPGRSPSLECGWLFFEKLPHLQSKVIDATVGRQARQAGGLQSPE
ncbi:hypothetical protein ALC56_06091 [Trachymyrmex septentrionalis]|uniref:Uncharacterized protein n=1 Tax=Trachymyrmex septentrionalis TaxID=34720 RepID=A0A195FH92_9HYME|nr:hypothetical protein ALC56_06091 [Trachymyrmex septentrionalis]